MEKADELLQEQRKQAGEAASQATGTAEYKSAADFDARLTGMLMADEAKERERQEKRIERQKIAQSMTDLGAVFGDVIKASGGALVTPRDVKAKYDTLDKNTQTVYDNYRTRMEALRKGIQDRTKDDMDAARKAKERAAAEQLQRDLLKQKENEAAEARRWEENENRLNREQRIRAAQIRYGERVKMAETNPFELFTMNDAQGKSQEVKYTKAEAKMYIPDIFRWMLEQGYIDPNREEYPHKTIWNANTWENESIPKLPTQLKIEEMCTTIRDVLYSMDNKDTDELLRRLRKKQVQTSIQPATTTTTATTTTSTPTTTTGTAATTNSGKKAINGFGGN